MDDEDIGLPADTLAILNQFLQEKALREKKELEKIETKAGKDAVFEEDWQLSQFWYSENTKKVLKEAVTKLTKDVDSKEFRIALLSCPSLYASIKEVFENGNSGGKICFETDFLNFAVKIFEFDKRFSAYGDDFIFYDFNEADTEGYLDGLTSLFDVIIADPPFLSKECITKVCKIIKKLQKPNAKIIFCSGEIVESWLNEILQLEKCNFKPEHERNLGNEFASFANFKLDELVKIE